MKFGMFMQPGVAPGTELKDSIEKTLKTIEWLEEFGFSEVWYGEHLAQPWEPIPSCDLVLARAMERTERIKLCTGGYVVPGYHPAQLAMRIAQMDQMLQGRFICGIAAGGTISDLALLHGTEDVSGNLQRNRDMTTESLAIMKKLWTEHLDNDWVYEGKFWNVRNQKQPWGTLADLKPHIQPFSKPYPQLAIAGTSPRSDTIKFAGQQGMIPLSFMFNAEFVKTHWDVYEEGAENTGFIPDRNNWRVSREVFVADTDAEARKWSANKGGAQYRMWDEFNLKFLRHFDWLKYVKGDQSVPDEVVDVDYLAHEVWPVGSPETVVERLMQDYIEIGGYGTVLVAYYDWGADPGPIRRSFDLLMNEVAPELDRRIDAYEQSRNAIALAN